MNRLAAAALVFSFLTTSAPAVADLVPQISKGNPIVPHIFVADPAAHVWSNDPGTLWVYTSHDHPGTNHYDTMSDYHAFSTTDLVHWTDHGQILSLDNVPWAASHAWAPDAMYYNGKYFLFYPMVEKTTGVFMVGLGVSDHPEGPFTDQGFIKGSEWGQDPAIFVDDDGQPYLYWGHDFLIYGAKLSKDLREIVPGTTVNLTAQLGGGYEGPWLNKINGKYYLSYAGMKDRKWPEALYYAVSDNPLGPYMAKGPYIDKFGLQSDTDHGSVVEFKGKWIAFYHSAWGSIGNTFDRSLMAEFLTINADGSWAPVVPTSTGISGGKTPSSRIWLEAEDGAAAGGRLVATHVEAMVPGYSGDGYVTGFPVKPENSGAYYAVEKDCPSCTKRESVGSVRVLAQVAYDQDYRLTVRYSADQDTRLHVFVNDQLIQGPTDSPNAVWAKATGAKFVDFDLGIVHLKAGDNYVELHTRDNKDARIDGFELIPQYPK